MAIARRSVKKQAELSQLDEESDLMQDALGIDADSTPRAGGKSTAGQDSPPRRRFGAGLKSSSTEESVPREEPSSRSAFGLFRGRLTRFRENLGSDRVQAEEVELPHPPMLRPSDHQKMGFVSPVYSLSRSVRLNPRVMSANRCVAFLPDSPEVEFYRQLRTRVLQLSGGKGGATVMVTSALPGEGKTLTAINLALTFAKEFKQTALLVDCDLRQQQVHSQMGFPSERGLVDYLMDDCPITELFVWPGVEKLSVISGGKTVRDSCELLGSPGMQDLVHDMKHRYPERYVFFDAPAILTSADAIAFAPLVDYILVVARAGQTSLKDINRAVELLPPEKVLGLVMNHH